MQVDHCLCRLGPTSFLHKLQKFMELGRALKISPQAASWTARNCLMNSIITLVRFIVWLRFFADSKLLLPKKFKWSFFVGDNFSPGFTSIFLCTFLISNY